MSRSAKEPVIYLTAVKELHAGVQSLAALDPAELSDAELVEAGEELLELRTRLEALTTRLVGRVHDRDAASIERGRSTRNWLIEDALMAPAEAGRMVHQAKTLPQAPASIEAAYDAGDLPSQHVSALLGVAAKLPVEIRESVTEQLVAIARITPLPQLRAELDKILTALDDESAKDRFDKKYAERGVSVHATMDGIRSLSGTLTDEVGELLEKALQHAAQPAGEGDDRSARQRMHDGLGDIARHYLATADLPTQHGAPTRVVVTMELGTLLARLHQQWADPAGGWQPPFDEPDNQSTCEPAPWARYDSGALIPPDTARRLACDAELIPAVLGGRGQPLDLGQAGRGFTTAIRRGAILRDGPGCVYPRCTRPVAEFHHIHHRARHGADSLDNCAALCSYHHWLVHEGHWSMHRNADNSYTFTNPYGRDYTGSPPGHAPPDSG